MKWVCYLSGLVMESLAQRLSDRDIPFQQGHSLHLSHFKAGKAQALETLFVIKPKTINRQLSKHTLLSLL